MGEIQRIVLAYSGGLDTSVILRWLIERYGAEVICYVGDVGQDEDLEAVVQKALATGAKDCVVRDLREEFVSEYVFPALSANAIYEGTYLLGTSLARPVLALEQVRVAREVGADAVAHGCTGKGNDQLRFELAFQALAPELRIVAPWRRPAKRRGQAPESHHHARDNSHQERSQPDAPGSHRICSASQLSVHNG